MDFDFLYLLFFSIKGALDEELLGSKSEDLIWKTDRWSINY